MMFKHLALTLVLALGVHAATPRTQTYIITLKPNANIQSHATERREGFELKHVYSTVLNGYAAVLSPANLRALQASGDVASIEIDQTVSIPQGARSSVPQLAQHTRGQLQKKAIGGAGVDIYFLDTGIQTTQACFGGRAVWGATFGGYANADGNGHGTGMAASALCASTGGTATSASGIAVKVLSDAGSGSLSDVIAGVNWVVSQSQSSGRPGIAALGLGGGASTALDNVVAAAVNSGVHVVVTAGFSALDVSTVSPARVAGAVTVGSLPRSKVFPSNSNFGAGIDVWSFYPISCPTGIVCTTPTNSVSYVAAYMAVAIGSYGNNTPAALSVDLKTHAVPDVTGVPAGTTNLRASPW